MPVWLINLFPKSVNKNLVSHKGEGHMTTIAIVGLGVVGGSFAKALKKNSLPGECVLAIDSNQETLDIALAEGVIEEGERYNQTILQRADLVMICLYPEALKTFVQKHESEFKNGAILTDVTGVKGALMANMENSLPKQVDFIFGHPMAGRENKGYAYADGAIFQGANYVITPRPENQLSNIEKLKILFERLGFKRISIVTPEKHDEMIAFTSQLCHAIAVSLINSDYPERETVSFIGDSYRDLTRIAKINAPLWTELFLENKDALLEAMNDFEKQFVVMKEALATENGYDLQEMFQESTERRQQLEEADTKLNGL